mmetsp:Transcript_22682/g.45333  ORF Transcript_22682/g.45333 Transcript_22682/m.45333 type:complete len:86 (+) Transcript_22682:85-342(+)
MSDDDSFIHATEQLDPIQITQTALETFPTLGNNNHDPMPSGPQQGGRIIRMIYTLGPAIEQVEYVRTELAWQRDAGQSPTTRRIF